MWRWVATNRRGRSAHAWLSERIGPLPERRQDAALATICCIFDLLGFSKVVMSSASTFPVAIVVYAAVGYVVLAWRRRAPVAVFAVMWAHSTIATIAIPDSYRPVIGLMVALYTIATLDRLRAGLVALALVFVPASFGIAAEVQDASPQQAPAVFVASTILLSLINCGSWSLGRWAHFHRRQVDLLEQQQELAARMAVATERSRIARDLHDIIAHSVSVMLLQAAGARRVLATDPERASAALHNIEGAGTQAMVELRRLLGILRTNDAAETDKQFHLPHGLAELGPLVDGVRTAGVPVRLFVHGHPGVLDPSVDLSAYRIVQEALTNVTKHAGPGTDTTITLRWEDDELHLAITNDGPELRTVELPRSPSSGHGLLGLRERAAAVGGRLEAGRLAGNGFRVTAVLPRADRSGAARDDRAGVAEVLETDCNLGEVGTDRKVTKPDREALRRDPSPGRR